MHLPASPHLIRMRSQRRLSMSSAPFPAGSRREPAGHGATDTDTCLVTVVTPGSKVRQDRQQPHEEDT